MSDATKIQTCDKEVKRYFSNNKVSEETLKAARQWLHNQGLDDTEIQAMLVPYLRAEDIPTPAGKAEIVRGSGDIKQVIIPLGMTYDEAVLWIQRQKAYEEQEVELHFEFDTFPLDGARAFMHVMKAEFGWVENTGIRMTFFGPVKKAQPDFIDMEVAPGVLEPVVWGGFTVPGIDGEFTTGAHRNRLGMWIFAIDCKVKRRHEPQVKNIMHNLRTCLQTHSVYRGQALHLPVDDEGEVMVNNPPTFMDLTKGSEDLLILNSSIEAALKANVLTPIAKRDLCRRHGVPAKRGILFVGQYGTGKTLAAHQVARLCVEHKVTFIYLDDPAALPSAVQFAKMYSPSVIFAEDIDRAAGIERDDECNNILNTIDGIDAKGQDIMVVLTTNHPDKINRAMLRPGRLDSVISFTPPGAEAVQRLIRFYGRESLAPDIDTVHAGELLAGRIPAVIREVVERAKLFALASGAGAERVIVGTEALNFAAENMLAQVQLLEALDDRTEPTDAEKLGTALRRVISNGSEEKIAKTLEVVEDIHERIS